MWFKSRCRVYCGLVCARSWACGWWWWTHRWSWSSRSISATTTRTCSSHSPSGTALSLSFSQILYLSESFSLSFSLSLLFSLSFILSLSYSPSLSFSLSFFLSHSLALSFLLTITLSLFSPPKSFKNIISQGPGSDGWGAGTIPQPDWMPYSTPSRGLGQHWPDQQPPAWGKSRCLQYFAVLRIRVLAKIGARALYLEKRQILKCLMNGYARYF